MKAFEAKGRELLSGETKKQEEQDASMFYTENPMKATKASAAQPQKTTKGMYENPVSQIWASSIAEMSTRMGRMASGTHGSVFEAFQIGLD